MLTCFTIETNAFEYCEKANWECLNDSERMEQIAMVDRLRKEWEKAGVLVHNSTELKESELYSCLKGLAGDIRKPLKVLLAMRNRFRLRAAKTEHWAGLKQITKTEDLATLAGEVALVCTTEEIPECVTEKTMKIPNNNISHGSLPFAAGNIELCRLCHIDLSTSFMKAREAQVHNIKRGTAITEVWRDYFRPWAEFSWNVVIVDRYAGSYPGLEGLRRFLKELDDTPMKRASRKVTLIIGCGDEGAAEASKTLVKLKSSLTRGGIDEVELYVTPETVWKTWQHGRHVRFDETVCEIDRGVVVLRGERVEKECQYTAKPKEKHEETEQELKDQCFPDYPRKIPDLIQ
jgi:hypothetical protein